MALLSQIGSFENIGYHTDISKKRFIESFDLGNQHMNSRVFQIFTKNPRQFKIEYVDDHLCQKTKAHIFEKKYKIFSHASYLLNMANPDKWAEKVENGVCELINIHKMGGIGTVFHVGKRLKLSVEIGLEYMEQYIVQVLTRLYEKYPDHNVYYIIETSCGAGSELLHKVEDLGAFHKRFTSQKYVNNPAIFGRVKLCIDSAHIFAAGWKIGSKEGVDETCDLIETHLGWENVVCIHLNDSAKLFHSCVDRHANIGSGFIGNNLKYFVSKTLALNIPHILETPAINDDMIKTHKDEIDLIKSWYSDDYVNIKEKI
jgi:deoxyribonuclease-4